MFKTAMLKLAELSRSPRLLFDLALLLPENVGKVGVLSLFVLVAACIRASAALSLIKSNAVDVPFSLSPPLSLTLQRLIIIITIILGLVTVRASSSC